MSAKKTQSQSVSKDVAEKLFSNAPTVQAELVVDGVAEGDSVIATDTKTTNPEVIEQVVLEPQLEAPVVAGPNIAGQITPVPWPSSENAERGLKALEEMARNDNEVIDWNHLRSNSTEKPPLDVTKLSKEQSDAIIGEAVRQGKKISWWKVGLGVAVVGGLIYFLAADRE